MGTAFVNKARKEGKIAFRSASSHSPIDCCIIDRKAKTIWFCQCKAKIMSLRAQESLYKPFSWLDGTWKVRFKIITKSDEN